MKTLRFVRLPALVAVACALLTACADQPPGRPGPDYRSQPSSPAQGGDGTSGAPGRRLTIQSGEGEPLHLPWFIRDTQDWINGSDPGRDR